MPITLLRTATRLRTSLRRLARAAERIDIVVEAINDDDLVTLLIAAAGRGAEVYVTTTLGGSTTPEAVERLVDGGVTVGTFPGSPNDKGRCAPLGSGVMIFDNETSWWTAVLLGGVSGTTEALSAPQPLVTLAETSDFLDGSDAAALVHQVLLWCDGWKDTPLDARRLARARKAPSGAAPRPKRLIEVKPDGATATISWQDVRRFDWGDYWQALLDLDRTRGARLKDSLCGPTGWLIGIEAAHRAYLAGPDAWARREVLDDLLGCSPASGLLGSVRNTVFATLLEDDAEYRQRLHNAIEQCVADPTAATMSRALAPAMAPAGVGAAELSRVLAAAAPDRFFSIADERVQVRLSNIVGFDLTARSGAEDQLARYIDAVTRIHRFPWADATSSERTSDHLREPDAWQRRMALLGCFAAA